MHIPCIHTPMYTPTHTHPLCVLVLRALTVLSGSWHHLKACNWTPQTCSVQSPEHTWCLASAFWADRSAYKFLWLWAMKGNPRSECSVLCKHQHSLWCQSAHQNTEVHLTREGRKQRLGGKGREWPSPRWQTLQPAQQADLQPPSSNTTWGLQTCVFCDSINLTLC
jgi:hypothetical protein